jgi:uridine kinase
MNLLVFVLDAFDTEQLVETLIKLKSGQSVQVPIYDFKLHQRASDRHRQVGTFLISSN